MNNEVYEEMSTEERIGIMEARINDLCNSFEQMKTNMNVNELALINLRRRVNRLQESLGVDVCDSEILAAKTKRE